MVKLTLEPASHGRTPEETKSHTAALITQFFFTLIDPNSNELQATSEIRFMN